MASLLPHALLPALLVALPSLSSCDDGRGTAGNAGSRKGLPAVGAPSAGEVRYPEIRPTGAMGVESCQLAFRFENREFEVSIPVEISVLEGARRARKAAEFVRGRRPDDLESRLHLAFVRDAALDRFYGSVLGELHRIAAQINLDSDRQLELIAAFVQHIPYEEGTANTRFPIEVVADNAGDCDEKSHLLAGLLATAGYSVALLAFDADDHMAVGVRADGLQHQGTGHMMIETTSPMLPGGIVVGTPSRALSGAPVVIPVADGHLIYTATNDLRFIESAIAKLRSALERTASELQVANDACDRLAGEVRSLDAEIGRSRRSGAADERASVERRNEVVSTYNATVEVQQRLVREHNRVADILNRLSGMAAARRPLAMMLREAVGG